MLGFVMLYDFEMNALVGSRRRRFFPCVSLIDKRYFYLLLGHRLNCFGQLGDLRPVLLIGGRNTQRQDDPRYQPRREPSSPCVSCVHRIPLGRRSPEWIGAFDYP